MTPLILAIDTTREYGSLALTRGDEVVEELLLHAPTGYGHLLFEALSGLLERNQVKPPDIDCFAAASGPGSFTGVRVGLACAKGLAEAVHKPAVAISNLRALAFFGMTPLRAAVIDARREEIYSAVYDAEGNLIAPEVTAPLATWVAALPAGEIDIVSQDGIPGTTVIAPRAIAAAIGRIACRKLKCGEAQDPAALDANYVRRSDAELYWKEY